MVTGEIYLLLKELNSYPEPDRRQEILVELKNYLISKGYKYYPSCRQWYKPSELAQQGLAIRPDGEVVVCDAAMFSTIERLKLQAKRQRIEAKKRLQEESDALIESEPLKLLSTEDNQQYNVEEF